MSLYKRLTSEQVQKLHNDFMRLIDKACVTLTPENTPTVLADYIKSLVLAASRKGQKTTKSDIAALLQKGPAALYQKIEELKESPFTEWQEKKLSKAFKNREELNDHDALFKGQKRLYLKVNQKETDSYAQKEISVYLQIKGYKITDYLAGYATDKDEKQTFKIGKLLKDDEDSSFFWRNGKLSTLYSLFCEDLSRSRKDMYAVISRDPRDIAYMSTNRKWKNCMTSSGSNFNDYAYNEIEKGTLIAYLISKDDPEVNAPLARTLIKPFRREAPLHPYWDDVEYRSKHPFAAAFGRVSVRIDRCINPVFKEDELLYKPTLIQGLPYDSFKKVVAAFAEEHLNAGKHGTFTRIKGLYPTLNDDNIVREPKSELPPQHPLVYQ